MAGSIRPLKAFDWKSFFEMVPEPGWVFVVKVPFGEAKSSGGIVMPTRQDPGNTEQGCVMACGDFANGRLEVLGRKDWPLKVGTLVTYNPIDSNWKCRFVDGLIVNRLEARHITGWWKDFFNREKLVKGIIEPNDLAHCAD